MNRFALFLAGVCACTLAAADSPPPPPAQPGLGIAIFAVTGKSASGGSCVTPATLPNPPLACETDTDRSRLAAFFGGTTIDYVGSARRGTTETGQMDVMARIGASRIYAGLRAFGDATALQSGGLALQRLGDVARFADETFPLGRDATVWIAHPVPREKDTCMVVRITTGTFPPIPYEFAGWEIAVVQGRIKPPRLEKKVDLVYPASARYERREGKGIFQGTIDRAGKVRFLSILKSPPGDDLAVAGFDAVSQWTFEPARLDGKPLDVYYTVMLTFKLEPQ